MPGINPVRNSGNKKKAPLESISNGVKVFSTPSCPYCVTLKEFLKERNVVFEDIDVSQDKAALDEMVEKSGQMGVPVVDIDGQIIVGFDKEKISRLLKIEG